MIRKGTMVRLKPETAKTVSCDKKKVTKVNLRYAGGECLLRDAIDNLRWWHVTELERADQ